MKIRRPALFIIGIIMVAMQIISIAGGERFDTNFWYNPGYMKGNASQIAYDIISTLSFLLIGTVGLILIAISFIERKGRKKDE